jgi:uncharacterized protein YcbX
MIVGRVAELWRHPVKSMQGEQIAAAEIGPLGIPGDRAWAVRDERRGGIRGAKKIANLMRLSARLPEEPKNGEVPPAEITLPDGSKVSAGAADAAERVSKALGTPVTLWPLLPATELEHYRRGKPDHDDVLTELRAIFGREPNEPLPNLAIFPPDIMQYESPPGTYFDAFPLLLLTDATLRHLAELAPDSKVDVRRFRPNLLIRSPESGGFPEIDWAGRRIVVGNATLEVTVPCPRCVMITHGFADLPRDPALMRTVVREANQNVGVYARVEKPGTVRVGDELRLVS